MKQKYISLNMKNLQTVMTFSKILSRVIYGLLILTTLTPLIFQKKLFFSYDSEKGLYFRFLSEIIIGSWLILIVKEPTFRPKKTPINLSLLVLSVVLLIVDVLGVDMYLSIFSNFERMAGLILYLTVIGYALVISSIINSQKRWLIFGISLAVVAFIVSLKGISQSYDQEAMIENAGRVVATIGNANQVAAYLILGFFIMAILMTEWILPLRKTRKNLSIFLMILASIFVIIYTICLLKTSTRGSLAGLLSGGVLIFILSFFKTKQRNVKIASASILLLLLIGISSLIYFRKTNFIQQNSSLNRITRIVDKDGTNTLQSRLENYKVAIEGIKARPILGWGQETYHYTYAQYFNPKLYADATWYDRVHNIILEWLIMGGIVGLLAYLALWGAILFQLWKKGNSLNINTKIIISGFLLAYFISNLSLFDNLLSLMSFMIIIAFIEQKSIQSEAFKSIKFNPKMTWLLSSIIIFLTFFVIKITCLQAYRTNQEIVKAYSAESLDEVITAYEQAHPKAIIGRQEITEQLANIAKDVANNPVPESTKQRYFEVTRRLLNEEIKNHPDYARLLIIYGNVVEAQGDNLETIRVFEKVKILAPKRQSSLIQLAMAYARNGEFDKANDLLEKTYSLEPQNQEPKAYQALVMAMSGNVEKRNQITNQLSDSGLNKHIGLIQNAFAVNNDLDDFLILCNKRFVGNINTLPDAYKMWATTAYQLKNIEQAATAVYAFRRHFAEEENFQDAREAHIISQEVKQGKEPSFAFEKVIE
jgi:O-antigen ligase/tetratricopeptide (TPR) repeat protein